MSDTHVTAVVVNWKLKEATLYCLRSLAQSSTPCRIIVVDNHSDDGSVEYLMQHFPQAELIVMPSNVGFAGACNRAITQALEDPGCEYVFLLNNDAIIHPQAITEMLEAAQTDPTVGILGSKVYYDDSTNTIWYAGARRRWGVLAAVDTGRGQIDQGQFDTVRPVDYVFGAAMLIHRRVFEKVGLFDNRFFMYLEDMDLCLRAQDAGFSLLFVPQSRVWHQGSASTSRNSALRNYYVVKSTAYFLKKHTTPIFLAPVFMFWILVSLRAIVVDIARGNLGVIPSYWTGFVDGVSKVSYE
ncbi:MAG: glycosyltransferase family 2 protein [Chloroflexota bacterium]